MYLGRIVEVGPVADVLLRPQHPYTQALIAVLPGGELGERPTWEGSGTAVGARSVLGGEPPDPTRIPVGCRFHPRCPRLAALDAGDPLAELCRSEPVPVLATAGVAGSAGGDAGAGPPGPAGLPGSLVACHLVSLERDAGPVDVPITPASSAGRTQAQ